MISMLRISSKGSEDVSCAIVLANATSPTWTRPCVQGSPGSCVTFLHLGLVLTRPTEGLAHIFCGRRGRTGNPVRDAGATRAADRYRMAWQQRTGCRPDCCRSQESRDQQD